MFFPKPVLQIFLKICGFFPPSVLPQYSPVETSLSFSREYIVSPAYLKGAILIARSGRLTSNVVYLESVMARGHALTFKKNNIFKILFSFYLFI
jgi:hypothetical protein